MAGSGTATASTALPAVSPQVELLLTALAEQVAVDPTDLPGRRRWPTWTGCWRSGVWSTGS